MMKQILILSFSLTAASMAHASAKCDGLKGYLAARLTDACESSAQLTPEEFEAFKSGAQTLVNECGESDFADALYRGAIFKKLGLAETCKERAKVLSHATGLNEA